MTVKDLVILGCSSQQPTRHRNHGAYLVRWNHEGFLFDPGEGTQRQFIYANIAPPTVTRIFVSHFHGDHCLGLGSMLMRLNLDKITHPVHCYYPASGKKYFDRLRYSTIYHERLEIIEHPVENEGLVDETDSFYIKAYPLDHGVDNFGWRIIEKDRRKFYKDKLKSKGIKGPMVKDLQKNGSLILDNQQKVTLDEVSYIQKGEILGVAIDTRLCPSIHKIAKDAQVFLCESTYLAAQEDLAHQYFHLTSKQAACVAKEANVKKLILTHFSARYQNEEDFATEAREIFTHAYAAQDLKVFSFN